MRMKTNLKRKILIIEDHKDMLLILKRSLEEHQFEVLGFENAEKGLEVLNRQKPDLVLLDLMLPGMSGLEALKIIKDSNKENGYIPVIIISAKSATEEIINGLKHGADDYLTKPFNLEELEARIETVLRIKDLNENLRKKTNELALANQQINQLYQKLLEKNQELRRNVFNLNSLFEISLELNSILEFDRLVNSILLTLIGQFSCKNALFMLASKIKPNLFEPLNSKGFHQKELENLSIERTDALIEKINANPVPKSIEAFQLELKKKSNALETLKDLGLEFIIPVIVQSKVEGLIALGQRLPKRGLDRSEWEHLSILSNIISIAVTNALLYNEIKQLSYTDGMTGLHNFRYFKLRLNEEVVRHKRTNSELSLLILDVDHFKNYNDTLGHPAGDEVLRKLASILRKTARENDIVARYGGEEFAIILPSTGKSGAITVAERIRSAVEKTYFKHEEIQPMGKVTVSVGLATIPQDATTGDELTQKADAALYYAKRHGRNNVKAFEANMEKEILQ